MLLRATDENLATSTHVLVFDFRVVGVPLPLRHLGGMRAALRLAVEILEVIERQHIEVPARLVVMQRGEVKAGIRADPSAGRRGLLRVHVEVREGVLVSVGHDHRVGGVDGDPIPVRAIGGGLRVGVVAVLDRRCALGDPVEEIQRVQVREDAGISRRDEVHHRRVVHLPPARAIDVVRPGKEGQILDLGVGAPGTGSTRALADARSDWEGEGRVAYIPARERSLPCRWVLCPWS